MTDTTRKAFEAECLRYWGADRCPDLDIGSTGYCSARAAMAWSFWQAATLAERDKRQPLTDEQLLIEFGKLYPNDVGILELAKHNKDYVLESIGARHHWTAFKWGAHAVEAAHGIKA